MLGSGPGFGIASVLGNTSGILRWNDLSAVAASAASFWTNYFSNPGYGSVSRFNRVFMGEAAKSSADNPQTTQSWLETLIVNTVSVSQLAVTCTVGTSAITGAARASDYRSWAGASSQGVQGINGYALNDDLLGAAIAVGTTSTALKNNLVTGITVGTQTSISNAGSVVDITPYGGVISGSTISLLLTGSVLPAYAANFSALQVLGIGNPAYGIARKGIICLNGALDTSVGAGGAGVAFEAYSGQSFRWLNSTNTVLAEIFGGTNGLTIPNGSLVITGAGNGFGYGTGAGTTGNQTTSRTTAIALTASKANGSLTLFAAAPVVGTPVTFAVTNVACAANDNIQVSVKSASNTYTANVTAISANTFSVTLTSVAGTVSDSPVLTFSVIKGSVA